MNEGIKELKEALALINEVSLELAKLCKDGVQLQDGMELAGYVMLNADFKAKFNAAIEGIGKVPAEMKDLQMSEIFELAQMEMLFIPQFVEALKK